MPTDRQRRIRELFDAVTDQPMELQEVYLRQACGADAELLRAVGSLIRARNRSGGLIDQQMHRRPAASESVMRDGTRVGAYKVLQKLGGGGMGNVYQVVRADHVFQRVAALKVIRPEFAEAELVERFRQEREILARLDHGNIARIIDGGSTPDGLPYFVMDYVDGVRIDQYCAQRSLSVRDRLQLFQQVCLAVQYLHQSQVVHGDLKPSNILVTVDGQAKILDFGVARLLHPSGAGPAVPDAVALMTPAYASPEQKSGLAPTYRSDIFSLGVVLYELLTGARPFPNDRTASSSGTLSGTTRDAVAPSSVTKSQTATGIPGDAARITRTLKGDPDAIVLQAIRFDPAERYASAADLSSDITNYLTVRAVQANRGGMFYRFDKFAKRNRVAFVAAGVFFVLSSAVLWQGLELRKRYVESQRYQEQVIELTHKLEEQMRKRANLLEQSNRLAPDSPETQRLRRAQLIEIRDLGDALRTSLSESVRLWPGMTPERQELVDQAQRYLKQTEPYVIRDAAACEQLSQAWLWLANLRGNPSVSNLGDVSGAVEDIRQSQRLLGGCPGASVDLRRDVQAAAAAIGSSAN